MKKRALHASHTESAARLRRGGERSTQRAAEHVLGARIVAEKVRLQLPWQVIVFRSPRLGVEVRMLRLRHHVEFLGGELQLRDEHLERIAVVTEWEEWPVALGIPRLADEAEELLPAARDDEAEELAVGT
jgi:hypothetical protein